MASIVHQEVGALGCLDPWNESNWQENNSLDCVELVFLLVHLSNHKAECQSCLNEGKAKPCWDSKARYRTCHCEQVLELLLVLEDTVHEAPPEQELHDHDLSHEKRR